MYCMKGGMQYRDIQEMAAVDREWHLARLFRQLKKEEEEHKKATAKMNTRRPRRRR